MSLKKNIYNILILGMGGDVSKGIWKAVKMANFPCRIIGACISSDSDGLYLCDEAYISPYASDDSFIPWLSELCNKKEIDIVLTGVEENIKAISDGYSFLTEHTSTIFRVPTQEQLEIGDDKLKTCLWLKEKGFLFPAYALPEDRDGVEELIQNVGFPLIAKPRVGKGSSGVFMLENSDDISKLHALENYVVEECVGTPEQEYTVGCYRGLHGEMPEPIVMKRKLKNGASWKTEIVKNKEIADAVAAICQEFLPNGPLNIQLRLNEEGKPVPFEFNVRFSGTTPMRARFGFCDVKAMLYESLLHCDINSCFTIQKGVAYRFVEEIYLSELPEVVENRRLESHLIDKGFSYPTEIYCR